MEPTADALIVRLRQQDASAVGEYVAAHRLPLMAYITRHLGPGLRARVEPDDILQDATLDALNHIADLADERREPFGWLCQLAEHRLVDAHRKLFGAKKRTANREVRMDAPGNGADRSPLVDLLVASMTTPSAAFSRDQNEMQLHDALATLPDESREALRLRYVENLSTRDIAQRLGKSEVALRVLLSRSLAKLQTVYGGSAPR